ncbi:MAG: hypothetical protein AAGB48_08520 [Planctomycetota bacterium]
MTLLSAMAIVLAGTVRSATGILPDAAVPLAWQTAAEAAVREVGRNLESRDRGTRLDRSVVIESQSLTVFRADRTSVSVEFDGDTLSRVIDGRKRMLIGEISSLSWTFDPNSDHLRVDIVHSEGASVSKTWSLAP